MKRAAIIFAMLAVATCMLAQQAAPAPQNQPAAATEAPAATPAVKRLPQAKTQPEFDAYKAAIAITEPVAMEKAADDFAAKFPDSEITVLIYRSAMHAYQTANNAEKMTEMGRKILKSDPDDPEALVGVAEALSERTRDSDLDKDQRLDEALKMSQRALETVDTDIIVPTGTPQEKVDAYKGLLRSRAYAAMGAVQYNRDKFADAETNLRKSVDAYPTQLDPVVVLRLALSLDKQEKYPEALKEANHAVDLTQEGTNAGTLARRERDRLVQLVPGAKSPTSAQSPTPPKN